MLNFSRPRTQRVLTLCTPEIWVSPTRVSRLYARELEAASATSRSILAADTLDGALDCPREHLQAVFAADLLIRVVCSGSSADDERDSRVRL